MFFNTMQDLKLWLRKNKKYNLQGGSQGECFFIGDKVYKIFVYFVDDEFGDKVTYNKEDIMQFSSIVNNTYVWPNDVIMVGDTVVGYVTDYVDAMMLSHIHPLLINLDKFEKRLDRVKQDIKIISDNGVKTFDVTYNTMYGKNGFKVIDTLEYSKTDIDSKELYKINTDNFNYEVRLFLIDGIFDKFMMNNNSIYKMCYDPEVDFVEFLKEFRKQLSEIEGKNIIKLGEARESICFTKSRQPKYVRGI